MGALAKIKDAGFQVTLNGDGFLITPSSKLTMPQREFLKLHKAEIVGELKAKQPEPKKGGVYCYRTTENPKSALVMIAPESDLKDAWESLRQKYSDRLIEVFVMPDTKH